MCEDKQAMTKPEIGYLTNVASRWPNPKITFKKLCELSDTKPPEFLSHNPKIALRMRSFSKAKRVHCLLPAGWTNFHIPILTAHEYYPR